MPGTISNSMPDRAKYFHFLASTTKDEWVAALEAHYQKAFLRVCHHSRSDFLLTNRLWAAALPDAF